MPRSTYRIQLHPGFTFENAAAVVPYLARLGITHLYCSPYLQATKGSRHGYDVVDHSQLNVELGGEPGHRALMAALARHGLRHILDIVPNHMAAVGPENRWWWDVLQNGPASQYSDYFDIDWAAPSVLVPVLGDHFGRVIDAGEVGLERDHGAFLVRYYEHVLPLAPRTFDAVLIPAAQRLQSPELANLARGFAALPVVQQNEPAAKRDRHEKKEALLAQLAALCEENEHVAETVDAEVDEINSDPDRLDQLLRRQHYRLAFWRTASEELDYRRFFNIETLVGLRVEDETVFADSHRLILGLANAGMIDGFRIDHVDGLRDPYGYLVRLRTASGGVYTVVEKILEADETLPPAWPVEGTSGYDFLNRVNQLFVASGNEAAMTACYQAFTGKRTSYADVVHEAKRQMMSKELAAEIHTLTRLLATICDGVRRHRDHTHRDLCEALVEVLAAFPVYRTYVQPGRRASEEDRAHVAAAVKSAHARRPDIDTELLSFLGELALAEHPGAAQREFALRLAQVSGPVMAKGVEDTAFYRYNRLISLNEVGGDPSVFGRPPAAFHRDTTRTAERWPETMLTLSTHDTKRSADVRARLNVLSEVPGAWQQTVAGFAQTNACHRRGEWPDRDTEYMLYQTLVGTWPIGVQRLSLFLEKAVREAKVHTSWVDPELSYEQAVQEFLRDILSDQRFLAQLASFLKEHQIVEYGRLNSLAQVTLLLTCPGVPDIYQGDELWDLSLVDPDNRRAVDYATRTNLLRSAGPKPKHGDVAEDGLGVTKLWLLSRLLEHRRMQPDLYEHTCYEPLLVEGPKAEHAVAFHRERLAVIVPRLVAGLGSKWGLTTVVLPRGRWKNIVTGVEVAGGTARLDALLQSQAVCVLERAPQRPRATGTGGPRSL